MAIVWWWSQFTHEQSGQWSDQSVAGGIKANAFVSTSITCKSSASNRCFELSPPLLTACKADAHGTSDQHKQCPMAGGTTHYCLPRAQRERFGRYLSPAPKSSSEKIHTTHGGMRRGKRESGAKTVFGRTRDGDECVFSSIDGS